MRFIQGALYRNTNCLDINFYIQKIKYARQDKVVLDIIYINRKNKIIEQEKNVTFKPNKFWERIN